ncbi:hypothetical protein ACRAJ3_25200 [Rhodococcus pyridinivorans]|uniref:hypothetical protein n=1 Tax=Rhodococcus pyridinivorans TaxID=103816 RepID=UPI003D7FBF2A
MTAPRGLADAQARLDATETALAGLVHENNELRAIIRRVREYAHLNHDQAAELRAIGRPYDALPHQNAAHALERIIGDKP